MQNRIDQIYEKIEKDYNKVSTEELHFLINVIHSRYFNNDIILSALSNDNIMINLDMILRSFYELTRHKTKWGKESKHYVLSNLMRARNGLSSKTRREIFIEKGLKIQDTIGFNRNLGYVKFLYTNKNNTNYLLLVHDYGYSSITNFVEEIISNIHDGYLDDIGFHINRESVCIFYKDIYSHYSGVKLDDSFRNPSWSDMSNEEIAFFEELWDVSLADEHANNSDEKDETYFFTNGQQYDAYNVVREILIKTQREILIIDPYINVQFIKMLEIIPSNVKIRVLTHKAQQDSDIMASKFGEQRGSFDLRITNKFHDRYIISDGKCFLLGSSINSFASKATTLIQIKQESVINAIRNYAESIWNS